MHRMLLVGFASFASTIGLCCLAGCNRGAANEATPTGTTAATSTASPSDAVADAVSRAAADFLDAVLKGDSARASARLTPQAMQRISESGTAFAPPGLASATYRVGEVRTPSPDQAIVQCVLTDSSEGQSEEMCCLLRRVESDWRVSGIAYGSGPDQPWMLSDFESGRNMAIPRQAAPAATAAPGQPVAPSRPSPRTAQEETPASYR